MAKKKAVKSEETLDDAFDAPVESSPFSFVRYDSATVNDVNREMFLHCDGRSADASNQIAVRARLREFARKEVANNSYAKGLTQIVASDMIGRGPRLQLEEDLGYNERVEQAFNDWANEIKLSDKLQTGKIAKMVDGEAFGVFFRDKRLPTVAKLNLRFIECDHIATPYGVNDDVQDEVDGIELDEYGEPRYYYILKEHPGDRFKSTQIEYSKVRAESIVHWFRQDRPEQHRGVSEFAPALPLFFMLRRYTLATVEAAEACANFPLVLYTDSPAIQAVRGNKRPFASFPLARGKMTTLPEGWELGQVRAEQPVTNYPDFKRELLAEVARCFSVPVNVISGDSSKHNYASGRLDFQTYHKALDVERKRCETQVLNRIFERWFEETYIRGLAPKRWLVDHVPKISWFWDGFPHVDPIKEANAQATRLRNFTTTFAEECAKQGVDWVLRAQQIAKEQKKFRELGIDMSFFNPKKNNKGD